MAKFYGSGSYVTTIPSQLKWKSAFGQEYEKAIRSYIEAKVDENVKSNEKQVAARFDNIQLRFAKIDFSDFRFFYNDQYYHPDNLPNELFKKTLFGSFDLTGIDLSGIRIAMCSIVNCSLSNANFSKSLLNSTSFVECNLNASSFEGASLYNVNFLKTKAATIDFTNAKLQSVSGFNDETLFLPFEFTEVKWVWLIKVTIKTIFSCKKYNSFTHSVQATSFRDIDTSGLVKPELKPIKRYIDWYQLVITKIDLLKQAKLSKQVTFVIALVHSKYWSSYSIFAAFAIFINLVFAAIILAFNSSFLNLQNNFFDSFYYSFITFTTLGYGDIHPQNRIGECIVIFDVMTGYIMLGIFILLLSRKIEANT